MPEGHSIHRLAAAFREGFGGQRVATSSPQGRFAEADELHGMVLTDAEAVGKHLFLAFAPSAEVDPAEMPTRFVHIHLGLYGSVTFAGEDGFAASDAIGAPRASVTRIGERETSEAVGSGPSDGVHPSGMEASSWRAVEPRLTTRLRVRGERGLADLTGPTACEILDHAGRQAIIDRLGPDPLRADADPQRFCERVMRSRTGIGVQLMNQNIVAGIGNIYRAELLFRARLDPFVPGNELPRGVVEGLWEDLVPLMEYGVRTGRIVTTQPEHRAIHAELMEPEHRLRDNAAHGVAHVPRVESFYVYHRQTLPCRLCERPIRSQDVAGRSLYWCASCQKPLKRRSPWTRHHPAAPWVQDETGWMTHALPRKDT